ERRAPQRADTGRPQGGARLPPGAAGHQGAARPRGARRPPLFRCRDYSVLENMAQATPRRARPQPRTTRMSSHVGTTKLPQVSPPWKLETAPAGVWMKCRTKVRIAATA